MWFKGTSGLLAAITLSAADLSPVLADDNDIDLKLFRTTDLPADPTGCHFNLWQENRDPAQDKYAYVFALPFSEDGSALPARMRVGDDFLELYEIAQATEDNVNGLPQHLVYRSENPRYRVIVELIEVSGAGSMAQIDKADIYVVRSGKLPFLVGAKGEFGCPDPVDTSSGAQVQNQAGGWNGPSGLPLSAPETLNTISSLPGGVMAAARQAAGHECDFDGHFAWGGAKFRINDHFLLWEVPCFSGSYQSASVFVVSQNPAGGWAHTLPLSRPQGSSEPLTHMAFLPRVSRDGVISMTALGRGTGDCGTHQVHRIIDGPSEEIELELLEYREKSDCDGRGDAPETWPLVMRAY